MPRRRARQAAIAFGIAAVVVLGLVAARLVAEKVAEPDEPTAFYDPPAQIEQAPGTVLRSETVAGARPGATVSRILYASTDPQGNPIAVSGVVVSPDRAAPAGGRPVIAWAHGTSGVAPRCAPSLESRAGVDRIPALDHLVASGAVVVATDYPGLGTPGPHPYLVGESEGRALLDVVRAGREFTDGDNERAAVFGHSQGGHAVLFAAGLAPAYAPDVDLVGAAPMAPPTDLAELMGDDESEMAGVILTAMAVNAWSAFYPGTPAREVVRAGYLPAVDGLSDKCIETQTQDLLELPEVLQLKGRFLTGDPADAPRWKRHFAANTPDTAPLSVPLFVTQGTADDIVRPAVTDRYVERQCAAGSVVDYRTYPGATHFTLRTIAANDVAEWMLARVDGEPATSTCSRP